MRETEYRNQMVKYCESTHTVEVYTSNPFTQHHHHHHHHLPFVKDSVWVKSTIWA